MSDWENYRCCSELDFSKGLFQGFLPFHTCFHLLSLGWGGGGGLLNLVGAHGGLGSEAGSGDGSEGSPPGSLPLPLSAGLHACPTYQPSPEGIYNFRANLLFPLYRLKSDLSQLTEIKRNLVQPQVPSKIFLGTCFCASGWQGAGAEVLP